MTDKNDLLEKYATALEKYEGYSPERASRIAKEKLLNLGEEFVMERIRQLPIEHKSDRQLNKFDYARQETEKAIEAHIKEPCQLSFLPGDLSRVSPFKPMRRRDMKAAKFQESHYFPQGYKAQRVWGTLVINSPDLAIREEDLFLLVLRRWVQAGLPEALEITYSNFLDEMGYKRRPTGKHSNDAYRAFKESLTRLRRTTVELVIDKEKIEDDIGQVFQVISFDKKEIAAIRVNQWFAHKIGLNMVAGINIEERNRIKGDIAKALHRFISSHRGESFGKYGIEKLVDLIGLNYLMPTKKKRALFRQAIKELIRIGFLSANSKVENDLVYWHRMKPVLHGLKLIRTLKND
jgi:hypothetical protein